MENLHIWRVDRCLGYLQLDLRATARRGAKYFDFGQAAKIFDYQHRIFGNLLALATQGTIWNFWTLEIFKNKLNLISWVHSHILIEHRSRWKM